MRHSKYIFPTVSTKDCQWLSLNIWHMVSEAAALPTVPLPKSVFSECSQCDQIGRFFLTLGNFLRPLVTISTQKEENPKL